jgi:hypothetical protein
MKIKFKKIRNRKHPRSKKTKMKSKDKSSEEKGTKNHLEAMVRRQIAED